MEETITMSELNDFIFCPASIYFHGLYKTLDTLIYHSEYQINGTNAHKTITNNTYSSSRNILQNVYVYTAKYNLLGKIDIFDMATNTIIERKNKMNQIYEGYIFQVYAQYFGLIELGYKVEHIRIHSLKDNKTYKIPLPINSMENLRNFERTLEEMNNFNLNNFQPKNKSKCNQCIYSNLCDRSLI